MVLVEPSSSRVEKLRIGVGASSNWNQTAKLLERCLIYEARAADDRNVPSGMLAARGCAQSRHWDLGDEANVRGRTTLLLASESDAEKGMSIRAGRVSHQWVHSCGD
jgi:hypothetical protein